MRRWNAKKKMDKNGESQKDPRGLREVKYFLNLSVLRASERACNA